MGARVVAFPSDGGCHSFAHAKSHSIISRTSKHEAWPHLREDRPCLPGQQAQQQAIKRTGCQTRINLCPTLDSKSCATEATSSKSQLDRSTHWTNQYHGDVILLHTTEVHTTLESKLLKYLLPRFPTLQSSRLNGAEKIAHVQEMFPLFPEGWTAGVT